MPRKKSEKKFDEKQLVDSILNKSKLTEEDAERIGHKLKSEIRKRFL